MRLSEHTFDRLNGRWNRFSWFGFFQVLNGKLAEQNLKSVTSSASDIIITMESLLIEGLEPRQNRKRGDSGFQAVEYIQEEDQALREREKRELVMELLRPKGKD